MKLARGLGILLGVKGLLCFLSMTSVVLALVSYTADVTIDPMQQFTRGATTATWTVYVNDVDEYRYLPGSGTPAGSSKPTFDSGDTSTYAFRVATDTAKVCAVKIELTSAVDNTKFSKFEITVERWDSGSSSWVSETLYTAATGSTTKSYIDGLSAGDAGYVHQSTGTTEYYLVVVQYSYDLVDSTSQITVTFQYTPLPQDSF